MNFIDHSKLKGCHALLSPSGYHWINYDETKLQTSIYNSYAQARGTILHDLAESMISTHTKLGPQDKHLIQLRLAEKGIPSQIMDIDGALKTLVPYINDAIGFRMTPEVVLYYSDICFGTTDAIAFNGKVLRISDLKTGVMPAKIEQLLIYSALFCLEYHENPKNFQTVLRIYQKGEVLEHAPEPDEVQSYIDRVIRQNDIGSELLKVEGIKK